MPEELTLVKKTENADKAARAYEIFKTRLMEDPFLTRQEKINKIRVFLDAHISVFDAYYKGKSLIARNQWKKDETLSIQAERMAREIAVFYRNTYTARTLAVNLVPDDVMRALVGNYDKGVMADSETYMDYKSLQMTDTSHAHRRDAPSSYMTMIRQSFMKHQRRTNLDFSDRDREDAILAARSYAPPMHEKNQNPGQDLNGGLSDAQIEGIRSISAFLFRNTLYAAKGETKGDRAHFVENIIARPPKEMLLLYYVILEDDLHGPVDVKELNHKLQAYVPDLERFRPKMFNGVMKGFLGRLRGESLLWDKLTNAVIRTKQIVSIAELLPIMPREAALISKAEIREMMEAAEDAKEVEEQPNAAEAAEAGKGAEAAAAASHSEKETAGEASDKKPEEASSVSEKAVASPPEVTVSSPQDSTVSAPAPPVVDPAVVSPSADTSTATAPAPERAAEAALSKPASQAEKELESASKAEKEMRSAPQKPAAPASPANVSGLGAGNLIEFLKAAGASRKDIDWKDAGSLWQNLGGFLFDPGRPVEKGMPTLELGTVVVRESARLLLPHADIPAEEMISEKEPQTVSCPKPLADFLLFKHSSGSRRMTQTSSSMSSRASKR